MSETKTVSEDLARNIQSNPANEGAAAAAPQPTRRRVPLSTPRRKLEVAPLPGYVLYWFLEPDIQVAIDAGYDFVGREEVRLNQQNPANSADESGNTDLGSRVTVLGNRADERGRPQQLVLMKIREDWWKEDRYDLDSANSAVVESIFGSEHRIVGSDRMQGDDKATAYVKQADMSGRRRGPILNVGLPKKA